jgi:hypothetical protein
MRQSAAIGIAVYVALMGGVIGGAYAAFDAVIGNAPAQTAALGVVKQGPGAPNSGKWTPVEIKREVAQLPPLPRAPFVWPIQLQVLNPNACNDRPRNCGAVSHSVTSG